LSARRFTFATTCRSSKIRKCRKSRFLPLTALIGTTAGSILWGLLADSFGRRAAILLSALMFIGTAICGVMPSFEWNLVMCFLMGASAGGLLPMTFTLMAEMIPAKHRGWLDRIEMKAISMKAPRCRSVRSKMVYSL
jgi:hypothetical protein